MSRLWQSEFETQDHPPPAPPSTNLFPDVGLRSDQLPEHVFRADEGDDDE